MLQSMFGQYRIDALLGRGGMGEVYRAYDTTRERDVALKLLSGHLAEDAEYQARFRRECRVAARLAEPHVVPIHDFGEIDGRLYLDMRLVDGTDLSTWLDEHGAMPPDIAVAVIGQVAQALDAAHAGGLVHRDVKPSNILLSNAGGNDLDAADVFAYLFDFGIAQVPEGASAVHGTPLTRAGEVPGTTRYVAPERFKGEKGDLRVDVYALACVLHQALTGSPPFDGDLPALVGAHLTAPPPKASVLRPGVPSELDAVVAKGMAKNSADRYPSAGELAKAARAVIGMASGYVDLLPPDSDPAGSHDDLTAAHPTARIESAPNGSAMVPRVRPPDAVPPQTAAPPPSIPFPVVAATPPTWTPPPYREYPDSDYPYSDYPYDAVPQPYSEVPQPYGGMPQPPPGKAGPQRSATVRRAWIIAAVFVLAVAAAGFFLPDVLSRYASDDAKLLAELPADFRSSVKCGSKAALRDELGARALVLCVDGPAGGPATVVLARFTTAAALDAEFTQAAETAGITATPGEVIESCRRGVTNVGDWQSEQTPQAGQPIGGGKLACIVAPANGRAYLLWTDRGSRTYGHIMGSDGRAEVLYDWWRRVAVSPP